MSHDKILNCQVSKTKKRPIIVTSRGTSAFKCYRRLLDHIILLYPAYSHTLQSLIQDKHPEGGSGLLSRSQTLPPRREKCTSSDFLRRGSYDIHSMCVFFLCDRTPEAQNWPHCCCIILCTCASRIPLCHANNFFGREGVGSGYRFVSLALAQYYYLTRDIQTDNGGINDEPRLFFERKP